MIMMHPEFHYVFHRLILSHLTKLTWKVQLGPSVAGKPCLLLPTTNYL